MAMKSLLQLAAAASFMFCLLAGLWILSNYGFRPNNALGTGIGLYFVGKAFFVGPMLLVAAERLNPRRAAAHP